jgi:hypothetical protein
MVPFNFITTKWIFIYIWTKFCILSYYLKAGQLGLNDTIDRYSPSIINGLNNVIQVSAAGSHTLALNKIGLVYGFGSNFVFIKIN